MSNIAKQAGDLWRLAHQLADTAGAIALPYFRAANQGLEDKGAAAGTIFDPVTRADREIETALREILLKTRPDDGIIGEEFANTPSRSGLAWVIDPIDGTRAFISGTPCWGVLIALCEVGETASGTAENMASSSVGKPILGVIDQPYIGERFCGGLGRAEMIHRGDTRPLGVRKCKDLTSATLFSTFPEIGTTAERTAFTRVAQQCRLVRYGLDCYAYALLAAGQIDLVIEAGLNAYDVCAPIALIEASGGVMTDWQGGSAASGGCVIAAGDRDLHAQALATIND